MKRYLDIEESKFELYYEKLLRIAKMEKNDAISEIDEFLYNLKQQGVFDDYDDEFDDVDDEIGEEITIEEFIKIVKDEISKAKRKLKNKYLDFYLFEEVKKRSDYIKDYIDEKSHETSEENITKLNKIKGDADFIISEYNYRVSSEIIDNLVNREIFTISSVRSILNELEGAETKLNDVNRFTDNLKSLSKQIKERCCKYRAFKKLKDAEIQEKMGNEKKAIKLKLEAQSLFEQDWEEIFKNREYYNLEKENER